jgi:hypothetical protein
MKHNKPETANERYTRAVSLLVEKGLSYDEIYAVTMDIMYSFRQGIGLGGEFTEIIKDCLEAEEKQRWSDLAKAFK